MLPQGGNRLLISYCAITPTTERAAILSWMTKSDSSPVTGQPLVRGALLPNNLVKSMVDELAPRST